MCLSLSLHSVLVKYAFLPGLNRKQLSTHCGCSLRIKGVWEHKDLSRALELQLCVHRSFSVDFMPALTHELSDRRCIEFSQGLLALLRGRAKCVNGAHGWGSVKMCLCVCLWKECLSSSPMTWLKSEEERIWGKHAWSISMAVGCLLQVGVCLSGSHAVSHFLTALSTLDTIELTTKMCNRLLCRISTSFYCGKIHIT